jgi:hypothetical protein
MEDPTVTQRWLDFLGQYGLKTKQITSFLLQAPPTFFKVRAAAARRKKEHSLSLSLLPPRQIPTLTLTDARRHRNNNRNAPSFRRARSSPF